MTVGRPFFGIGAMRAGTTWLYHVLSRHPDCALPPIKELHFFDTKYGLGGGDRLYMNRAYQLAVAAKAAANNIVSAVDRWAPEAQVELTELDEMESTCRDELRWDDKLRRKFLGREKLTVLIDKVRGLLEFMTITDTEAYVAYLQRHGEGATAFGEITPAYALLPRAAFAEIDRLFPDALFIFIMRDPIDRLWSHVRYAIGKAEKTGHGKGPRDPNLMFATGLKRAHLSRSTYETTIETLESVIPKERILYLFYEQVTSPGRGRDEIARIERALGLQPMEIPPETFGEARNASAKAKLTARNEREGLRVFAPTYAYIERKFGPIDGWRRVPAAAPSESAGAVP